MKENKFEGKICKSIKIEKQIDATQKYIFDECEFFINGLAYFIFNGNYSSINKSNCRYLLELYKKYNLKFYEYIVGDYDIGVWDRKAKKWVIVQGEIASSNTVYYFMENQIFLFDVILRRLLLKTSMKRNLNWEVADELISNGYAVGDNTLIQGIFKLPPTHILVYDTEKGDLRIIHKSKGIHQYPYSETNTKVCYEKYEEYLNFLESKIKGKSWALCLSSGYDSNYLLHYLRKHLLGEIITLTAGGKKGKNEIGNVNRILSIYKRIIHYEYVIDSTILEELPNIVWQLEGCVYDKGIFLDYILANKAKELDINIVIMGEGHDEIHNLEQKRNFLIYDILKKSSIFFGNKDIEIVRPYLEKSIVQIVCEASEEARKEKLAFKKYVTRLLPDYIAALLNTCGGSIDLETVFENEEILEKYNNIVLNSEIFTQGKMDYLYQKIGDRKQVILGCLYVTVFAKLYISGLYDNQFLARSTDTNLENLIL